MLHVRYQKQRRTLELIMTRRHFNTPLPKILSAILAGVTIWILYFAIMSQDHRLLKMNDWVATKASVSVANTGLMGAQEFIHERLPLHGNRLNLGAWLGFQEISINRLGRLEELKFRFQLDQNAYLWIFYDQDPKMRRGIRMSRNGDFMSGRFLLNSDGKIAWRERWNIQLKDRDWHVFHLVRESSGLAVYLDSNKIQLGLSDRSQKSFVTFRSGYGETLIDDVFLKTDQFTFSENFSPALSFNMLLISLGLYVLGFGLCCGMLWWSARGNNQSPWLPVLAGQLLLLILVSVLSSFDYYFWSDKYFYNNRSLAPVPFQQITIPIERFRREAFRRLSGILNGPYAPPIALDFIKESVMGLGDDRDPVAWQTFGYEIDPSGLARLAHPESLMKHDQRVIFLGASQTWGAGAREMSDSFPALMIQSINQHSPQCDVAGVNISRCGSTLGEMLPSYFEAVQQYKPSAAILNLGSNDSRDPSRLAPALEELAAFNKTEKIATLISLEAEAKEVRRPRNEAYAVLEEFARRNNFPLVDTRAFLNDPQEADSGLLWKDAIHLDDAGHRLVGEKLAMEFGQTLCERKPKPVNLKR